MLPAADDLLFAFGPAKRAWKPLVKRLLTGSFAPLTLKPHGPTRLPRGLRQLGLYLHVPFCRNLCPFCPYHRVKYDPGLYADYERAVQAEIDLYAGLLDAAGPRPPIVSLYVGGGTPTVDPEGLGRLLHRMVERFGTPGDICVELHPAAMDDGCLEALRQIGVTQLSVGVQSTNDRLLQLIGRSHDGAIACDAVARAIAKGFDSVNVDLMFSLPTQTLDELDRDLATVLGLGAEQISSYPLFGFPYSDLGRARGLTSIERPRGDLVRRMLALIRQRAEAAGLEQCAVWSFIRPRRKKFSSVTRHHYLGFGPSAASMTGNRFWINTFSLEQYAATLPSAPIALSLDVDQRLEMSYWLYWRAYEMKLPRGEFRAVFGVELEQVYGLLLRILETMGVLEAADDGFTVRQAAAYWIHRLQNEYSLNYIDRVWGRCRREAWPQMVEL